MSDDGKEKEELCAFHVKLVMLTGCIDECRASHQRNRAQNTDWEQNLWFEFAYADAFLDGNGLEVVIVCDPTQNEEKRPWNGGRSEKYVFWVVIGNAGYLRLGEGLVMAIVLTDPVYDEECRSQHYWADSEIERWWVLTQNHYNRNLLLFQHHYHWTILNIQSHQFLIIIADESLRNIRIQTDLHRIIRRILHQNTQYLLIITSLT